jgi:hypothetical protein
MTDDDHLTWGFILEVLDIMERRGYRRKDNEHAGQAIGLIGDVARIYEGTLDAPRGGYVVVPSSRPVAPQTPGPPAVIVSAAEVKTLLAALDEAAEYKRDRAEASTTRHRAPDHAAPPSAGPQAAPDKEAGQ